MAPIIYFICVGLLYPVLVQGGATVKDCGDKQKIIAIKEGSVKPDPVQYPGTFNMTVAVELLKDIVAPQVEIRLFKTEDDMEEKLELPCYNGVGSCTYDLCEMIEKYSSQFCSIFPDPEDCGCPIKAGSYFIKDAPMALPDLDLPKELIEIIQGTFEAIITAEDSGKLIGCFVTKFDVVPAN